MKNKNLIIAGLLVVVFIAGAVVNQTIFNSSAQQASIFTATKKIPTTPPVKDPWPPVRGYTYHIDCVGASWPHVHFGGDIDVPVQVPDGAYQVHGDDGSVSANWTWAESV